MTASLRRLAARAHARGQSMVELALILPVLLLLVLGTLEFGFVFDHHLTLEYATREGARTGAALVNGGGDLGCGGGQSPNAGSVDPQIIAAVERVLTSPGARVELDQIGDIRIYKADANGNQASGSTPTIWTYTPNAGPVVDGQPLDFSVSSVGNWPACARSNTIPESIGVSLTYTYNYRTALTALIGVTQIQMTDRTVMSLNPTQQ